MELAYVDFPSLNITWRTVVLASLVFLIMATMVLAWWYPVWRVISDVREGPYEACALYSFWYIHHITVEKFMCHDGSGYCYPTGETIQRTELRCEP